MVLIAESGSTKCDWRIYDDLGKHNATFHSIGLNPNFLSRDEIGKEVLGISGLLPFHDKIRQVYFFGAGCSETEVNLIIENALKDIFINARIKVDHDLMASAYACYDGQPGICCILGTGSNSCYFDGRNIREEVPSLGYILGDEASGSYFGKKIVAAYFYKQLPSDIEGEFKRTYPELTYELLKKRVYRQSRPNAFLAGFMPFVAKYRDRSPIQQWIMDGIDLFIKNHILCFPDAERVPIHFVGTVAAVLKEEIQERLAARNFSMGKVIAEPAAPLAKYIFINKPGHK